LSNSSYTKADNVGVATHYELPPKKMKLDLTITLMDINIG